MSFQTADKMTKREILQTGIKPLDSLLGGSFELGITHFSYGSKSIREMLHRIAVHAQIPPECASTIIIDSANIFRQSFEQLSS